MELDFHFFRHDYCVESRQSSMSELVRVAG